MNKMTANEKLPDIWALIPCGGTGTRAQSEVLQQMPKQYRMLAGQPMILHTLAAFAAAAAVVVAAVVVGNSSLTPFF